MTNEERRGLIERYREGYAQVDKALAGIGPTELDAGRGRARGPRARSCTISPTAR